LSTPSLPDRAKICVIIAAKDAEQTIGKAVRSALRQAEVSEVAVVVDGAADGTANAARAADDQSGRLSVSVFEVNRGPSAARNAALKSTRADLICVLDADDYLIDGRFGRMLAQGGSDWELLADDLFLADEATPDSHDRKLINFDGPRPKTVGIEEFVQNNISVRRKPRQELGYLKPLMRADFLKAQALSYDERLRLGEDYELYARAILLGARFALVPACGYVAVAHAASLSHQHGATDLTALADADLRLVELAKALGVAASRPLLAHRKNLIQKRNYRLMLDAKRRSDWVGVFVNLLRTPSTTAYILWETLYARMPANRRPQEAIL